MRDVRRMAVLIVLGMQRVFLFSYELVRYTDNHDEYLKAMGSPAALMWMARLHVERFTIHDVSDDGLITFYWKFRKIE